MIQRHNIPPAPSVARRDNNARGVPTPSGGAVPFSPYPNCPLGEFVAILLKLDSDRRRLEGETPSMATQNVREAAKENRAPEVKKAA